MTMKSGKSILNMSLREAGDEILETLLGLVVSADKPEHVDRLTFSGLVSRATLLTEKYPRSVKCKCIICKNTDNGVFSIGIWPTDSNGNVVSDEYGMGQRIIETASLDDKLYGFLKNGVCANFMLELNN